MNIFKYEILQNRKSVIGWTIGLLAIACLVIAFLPSFMEETDAYISFMEGLSDVMLTAMGIDVGMFFSAVGFYSYVFMYIILIGSIQALAVGLNMLSKETRMKTADFLMTKPGSRTSVFLWKLLAAVVTLLITQVVYYIVTYEAIQYAADGDLAGDVFLKINFALSFVQFVFLAAGILCSQLIRKIRTVTPVAVGLAFVFFMAGMIAAVADNKLLRYLSPMRYFDTNYIMVHGSYEGEYVILSIGLVLVFTIAGYILFTKKDIPAV